MLGLTNKNQWFSFQFSKPHLNYNLFLELECHILQELDQELDSKFNLYVHPELELGYFYFCKQEGLKLVINCWFQSQLILTKSKLELILRIKIIF